MAINSSRTYFEFVMKSLQEMHDRWREYDEDDTYGAATYAEAILYNRSPHWILLCQPALSSDLLTELFRKS